MSDKVARALRERRLGYLTRSLRTPVIRFMGARSAANS